MEMKTREKELEMEEDSGREKQGWRMEEKMMSMFGVVTKMAGRDSPSRPFE